MGVPHAVHDPFKPRLLRSLPELITNPPASLIRLAPPTEAGPALCQPHHPKPGGGGGLLSQSIMGNVFFLLTWRRWLGGASLVTPRIGET